MLRKSAYLALLILSVLGFVAPAANAAPKDYSATARNIIQVRLGAKGKSAPTLEAAHANFDKLSLATAQRVVRFWQISPSSIPAAI